MVGDPIGADGHSLALDMTNERRVELGWVLGVCYCNIAILGTTAIFDEGFYWAKCLIWVGTDDHGLDDRLSSSHLLGEENLQLEIPMDDVRGSCICASEVIWAEETAGGKEPTQLLGVAGHRHGSVGTKGSEMTDG
jgi:hypothetical protein